MKKERKKKLVLIFKNKNNKLQKSIRIFIKAQ
jgi:hypothetical protein